MPDSGQCINVQDLENKIQSLRKKLDKEKKLNATLTKLQQERVRVR